MVISFIFGNYIKILIFSNKKILKDNRVGLHLNVCILIEKK